MQQVVSLDVVQRAISNTLQNEDCNDFHPGMSCNRKAFSQFVIGSKSVAKMYMMVHLIPFLLFKRKKVRQNPIKELLKLLVGFCKSLLFAGGYTGLVRRIVCLVAQNHAFVGYSNFIAAVFSSVTLLFEPVSRQSQIALFCLNKSTEVVYMMARRRGWPVKLPKGECILAAVSSGVVMYHYFNCPEAFRDSYLKGMNKLFENS